jgi:hypothetical protein
MKRILGSGLFAALLAVVGILATPYVADAHEKWATINHKGQQTRVSCNALKVHAAHGDAAEVASVEAAVGQCLFAGQ